MRKLMIALAVMGATSAAPSPATAQVRPAAGQDSVHLDTIPREALPRDVAREATDIYNRTATLRSTERLEIAAGRVVDGDVAVLNGPVILAGRINGRLLAINSDVVLAPGARIDGDLMVIGGEVEGRDSSFVGGEIRIYRQRLRYDQSGDRIVAARDTAGDERWWRRWERRRQRRDTESRLLVASAGAYNRTEGLPVIVGPSLRHRTKWGAVNADAFAVLRTETSFRHDRNDVGHDLRAELRLGRRDGVALEGRAYNVADPVERWQLSDLEAGLATFVVKRDYRDYFTRHGGSAGASLFREGLGKLSLTYAHEAWGSRAAADPWVLFRDNVDWRPNPMLDAGRLHLLTGGAVVDTRNDEDDPWAGWYVSAQVERGQGELTTLGLATPAARRAGPGPVAYTRGFVDARRYNRLGPGAQLNFRLVAGGWMGGDELPLERRLSVDGPGALPGYGFRASRAAEDRGTCGGAIPGMPAQCDRIALGQVEYRGDLHFGLLDWWDEDARVRLRNSPVWVVFADAGRGWLVNETTADSSGYGRGELPALSTFRTDIGAGLDFGSFGVYVAKAMSDAGEPARFFVRLRHRF